jgi:hypothetical protein
MPRSPLMVGRMLFIHNTFGRVVAVFQYDDFNHALTSNPRRHATLTFYLQAAMTAPSEGPFLLSSLQIHRQHREGLTSDCIGLLVNAGMAGLGSSTVDSYQGH